MSTCKTLLYRTGLMALLCSIAMIVALGLPCVAFASTSDGSCDSADAASKVDANDADVDAADISNDVAVQAEESGQKATITFYGPTETTMTVDEGSTLSEADIPSAPQTVQFDNWTGQPITGEFVDWYKGAVDEGQGGSPSLYDATNEMFGGGSSTYKDYGAIGVNNSVDMSKYESANGYHVEEYEVKSLNGYVETELDAGFLPVYQVAVSYFELYVRDRFDWNSTSGEYVLSDKYHGLTSLSYAIPKDLVLTTANVRYIVDYITTGKFAEAFDIFHDGQVFLGFFASDDTSKPVDLTKISPAKVNNGEVYALFGFGEEYKIPGEGDLPAITVKGDTKVKAEGALSGANIPEDAEIYVDAATVASGEAFDALNDLMGDSRVSDIFEIKLIVNGEEIHDGFGNLTLSIPVDSAYDGHVMIIFHRHQDGSITTSNAVAKGGYVSFTVTDLSDFALEDGGLPQQDDDMTQQDANDDLPPKTGDNGAFPAALLLIALLGFAFFTKRLVCMR